MRANEARPLLGEPGARGRATAGPSRARGRVAAPPQRGSAEMPDITVTTMNDLPGYRVTQVLARCSA